MVFKRRHPAGSPELAVHQRFAGVLPAALVWRTGSENRSDLFSRPDPKTDLICFLEKQI
jgi:hypothetical protein